jgi:hypothetical protein
MLTAVQKRFDEDMLIAGQVSMLLRRFSFVADGGQK